MPKRSFVDHGLRLSIPVVLHGLLLTDSKQFPVRLCAATNDYCCWQFGCWCCHVL